MFPLVYFSSQSENTHRFVTRLGLPARRIPLDAREALHIDQPYILVVPSYGGGSSRGAVPRQVIQFLNDEANRRGIRGVIAAGNRNFGAGYCLAGSIIAKKCQVPCLYRFELMGTPDDIAKVKAGVTQFWQQQIPSTV
ncbi:class Ib ribonucleoside-diphosphate reductase assembly flavoprotein NrdI [Pantoea vagans]|uniref:class Ib ribonucleoside-diphosphate reductase assembly flavoprotein NrdI n=1 Tax=Pantoea vagans TaxID=470934 RepID=UPI00241E2716|nr:class Ib ribonucleoside-diphosphate reductase assembly flavoprotein NrdI [Pantoea vagans]